MAHSTGACAGSEAREGGKLEVLDPPSNNAEQKGSFATHQVLPGIRGGCLCRCCRESGCLILVTVDVPQIFETGTSTSVCMGYPNGETGIFFGWWKDRQAACAHLRPPPAGQVRARMHTYVQWIVHCTEVYATGPKFHSSIN